MVSIEIWRNQPRMRGEMSAEQSKPVEQLEHNFQQLLVHVSLVVDQDPHLSPAAKFGLTTEFKALRKLGEHFKQWQLADTRQLITHLAHIDQLSTNISDMILVGLEQWPFLLPENFSTASLKKDQTQNPIAIRKQERSTK